VLTQAYGAALPRARPGFILFVQTFGDLVNFKLLGSPPMRISP
jgi:hypothetical protein